MQTKQSIRKWSLAGAAAIAAVAALALAWPTAASAGDEFEDGFKDELGRISAHEAVGVGRVLLGHILYGGYHGDPYPRRAHPTYHPRYRDRHYGHSGYSGYSGYYDHGRRGYDRYVYHEHHHYKHKRKHYKRHHRRHRGHGHGHGHQGDCDYDD